MADRRKNSLRTQFVNCLILTLLLFVSACRHAATPARVVTGPQVLRWAISQDIGTLDWNRCENRECLQYASLVMDGLMRFSEAPGAKGLTANGLEVVPALADHLAFESPTKLVIHIKKGVRWTNGSLLTARDFIAGWRRALLSYPHNPYASILFPIRNARRFAYRKRRFRSVGVRAIDALTLVVCLEQPDPAFVRALAHPVTFPFLTLHHRSLSPAATLGPFIVDKYAPHTLLSLRKNSLYYGVAPKLARIVIQIVPDLSARIHLFVDKEVDIASNIRPQKVEQPASLFPLPAFSTEVLVLNTARRPFNALGARRAIAEAINRDEFGSLFYDPCSATARLAPWSTGEKSASWSVTFSPEHALKLLASIGFGPYFEGDDRPKRFNPGVPVSLVYGNAPVESEIAQNLQAQWIKNLRWEVDTEQHDLSSAAAASAAALLVDWQPNPFSPAEGLDRLAMLAHEDPKTFQRLLSTSSPSPSSPSVSADALNQLTANWEASLVGREFTVVPLCHPIHYLLKNGAVSHFTENAIEILDFRDTTIHTASMTSAPFSK